jgi:hypothetical protein
MGFTISSLAAMIESNSFTFWRYLTADTRATVSTAGYFAPAAGLLRAGDLMLLQTTDAMALLPVRTGPTLGPGTTLDGVVGPISTVRSVQFKFTVGQMIGAVVRTIALAPLVAGIVVGSFIPVSAQVTGAVSSVVFGVYDLNGGLVPPEVTAPVINGTATAILAAPTQSSSYRILARDADNPAMVTSSYVFNVGSDLQFLLQEDDNNLLIQTGSGLKQS